MPLTDEKIAFSERLRIALKRGTKTIDTATALAHEFNLRHPNEPITPQAAQKWLDMLEKNPASKVPLFNVDNKVEHYLDDDQLQRLLVVLRSPDSPRNVCLIALFLLSTGARLNEALQAKWSQIDRRTRVWRIPAAVSKSGKIRVVPLNDSALDGLAELDTEGEFDGLFVNRQTGKPYTTIMKVWSRLRLKAGLPHFRIHDLRHMYASFLVNAGFSLFCVQQVLGHADSATSARYSHLSVATTGCSPAPCGRGSVRLR